MKRERGTGSIFRFKDSSSWWIKYHKDGRPYRESSHSANIDDAKKLLKKRLAEVLTDTHIEPVNRRIACDDLYAMVVAEYRDNDMRSLEGLQQRWDKRLCKYFSGKRALSVTMAMLNKYVVAAKAEGLSNATVNRDLSALRHGFYLAFEGEQIKKVPHFPMLREADARTGFVEERDYRRMAERARPLWFRAMLECAYRFGFRKGELLALKAGQVDLFERVIRLNPSQTKNRKPRLAYMTDTVFTLLSACVAGKAPADYVFTRENGEPVRDFRERWEALTRSVGLPDLLFHDLRRSAVRNMIRRGIARAWPCESLAT
jgi:integrase